jgi:hypothetical protein
MGHWALGMGKNHLPQSPITNHQSPITNHQLHQNHINFSHSHKKFSSKVKPRPLLSTQMVSGYMTRK